MSVCLFLAPGLFPKAVLSIRRQSIMVDKFRTDAVAVVSVAELLDVVPRFCLAKRNCL